MNTMWIVSMCAALSLATTSAYAQEPGDIVGKYSGSYQTENPNGSTVSVGVELTISKVENGIVSGTLKRFAADACRGDYVMMGKFNGETLGLRSQKGGTTGDCTFSMSGKVEGNKVVGTVFGKRPLQMTRQ